MRFWVQPRQPCIGLVVCATAAILAADHFAPDPLWIWIPLVLSAVCWCLRRRLALFWILAFCAIFLRHELKRDSAGKTLSHEFDSGARPVHGIGIVLDDPRPIESSRGIPRSRFAIHVESLTAEASECPRGAKAVMIWKGSPPEYGDRVIFSGDAENIPPVRNPGEFDFTNLQHRRGIFSEIHIRYANDAKVESHGHGNPLIVFASHARSWMQQKLTVDLHEAPDVAGLVQSMVLGLKDETPLETREMFQRTGTLHLFVVNGLHVGMFGLIAWFILKPLGIRRRASVFIIVPLLAFYSLATGFSPGSIRATVMAAILLGGFLADRDPLSFNSLAAAAFIILMWDSNELFMPGFQFSFGVVFTILLLSARLRRRLLPLAQPDPFLPRLLWTRVQNGRVWLWQRIATLIAVTTSASVGSSPFTATYFHLLAPSSLLANLLVVPLALGVLFEGVLSMVGGIVSNAISALFNNVNFVLAHMILSLVHLFAEIPGGHVFLELPKRHSACEITVLDLGAGGAAYVRGGGCNWLIDCGNDFAYENTVRPLLRSRGVNRLDGLVLTHGDVAHIGAAPFTLADFSPREIVDSALVDRSPSRRAIHGMLAAKRLGKSICVAGDVLSLGENISARVLYPSPDNQGRTADDKALVLQIESCGTRVLCMSDSGFPTEQWLLNHEADLRSDILVKGQHASDISGSPDFLAAVKPRVIICSGASFPRREQVSEDWAHAVAAHGIALFRQDQTGAVEIAIDSDGWNVNSFLGHQVFTNRSR